MYPWSQTFVSIPPVFLWGKFPLVGLQDLLSETSLLDCSEATAYKHGGPLTKHALAQINQLYSHQIQHAKDKGLSAVIDAYVHRLQPGQYPMSPGWHCPCVPKRMYNGQPNFDLILPEQFNVGVTLSSEARGVSNSEFVQTIIKPKIWDKDDVFGDLNVQVDKIHPETMHAKDGQFTWTVPRTIMRSCPARVRGVRLFVRLSMFPKPALFNAVGVPEQVFVVLK
jgi:hypothetical protein